MQGRGFVMIFVAMIVAILASNSLFIVKETERAVLLKFGEVVDPDVTKGLHVKFPLVHEVRKFDARIQTMDSPPERYLTKEKKPLDVDFYAKWRIKDTSKFYTATNGEEDRAQILLQQRINTGLRNQFGERTVHEVVSGERDELMTELTFNVDIITEAEFGIELVDIRVKRIDLPNKVSSSVFDRMRSEREREAREHRSTGKELGEKIRAAADREQVVIRANAYREAELIKGDGDAMASGIYAAAFSKDAEFYSFTRSLNAYRDAFKNKGDMLVVDSESEFFQYLHQAEAK